MSQYEKSSLPRFREGSNEEFLALIQDFVDWTINYELNQDVHIDQVYKSFHNCIKGDPRNIWFSIIQDTPLPRSQDSWQAHLELFVVEILPEGPTRKQLNYLKKTRKPKWFTSRQWLRRIRHINSLLPVMGKNKPSEEGIVKDVIT